MFLYVSSVFSFLLNGFPKRYVLRVFWNCFKMFQKISRVFSSPAVGMGHVQSLRVVGLWMFLGKDLEGLFWGMDVNMSYYICVLRTKDELFFKK